MLTKAKQIATLLLIVFLGIILLVALLSIWNFIDYNTAKDIIVKLVYTFVAILVISLIVAFITRSKE
jgi:Zn-dependent protease with chaperone function